VATRSLIRHLAVLFLLGVGLMMLMEPWNGADGDLEARALSASLRMEQAIEAISQHRQAVGPPIDASSDINRTGLIGAFYSPMTTTVGHLEAKRTSTSPEMAGLLVQLLKQADVRPGDFIAVGASGSFPGLILAVLCAAEAMDLDVGLIVSLGASQWGANLLEFTWIEIERVLVDANAIVYRAAALSLGGDLDIGRDLGRDVQEVLRERIEAAGTTLLWEPDLASNVMQRMAIYEAQAGERPIRAFVNVGGGWSNMGTDASVLTLAPGVNQAVASPPESKRGVLHAMSERGATIIHLLNLKELTQQYGLAWDPSPLPAVGRLRFRGDLPVVVSVAAAGYVLLSVGWILVIRRRRSKKPDDQRSATPPRRTAG
jgi:poly-gamma-glutamate system protein